MSVEEAVRGMDRESVCTTGEYTTGHELPAGRHKMTNASRWATKEEVAEHLRVSTKTVQRMTERGELTAHPVGPRLIRYDLSEIDTMLSAAAQETP